MSRLRKTFADGHVAVDVPEFRADAGEMVGLIGASGSGKSTFLRHMAGLIVGDRDGGPVQVQGAVVQEGGRLSRRVRQSRAEIGFVFQQFNLVDRSSVMRNVLTGALSRHGLWRTLPGWFPAEERERALAALARVGMGPQAYQRASTLSGGQQQRAAIARTLVQGARLILADEPIASLDPTTARQVLEILAELNRVDGITVVVSLHQVELATAFCRRIVALRAGRIVFDGPVEAVTPGLLARVYEADRHTAPAVPSAPEPGLVRAQA
ncbi:MAG: phosphonate ABC transporter ATP-binding protein [Acetobacteraceae bacterium]